MSNNKTPHSFETFHSLLQPAPKACRQNGQPQPHMLVEIPNAAPEEAERLHVPLSTDHLAMLIAFWECGTYSWTALAMERAVDPVSLTLSKVTFGRSSSSLSLLLCLGDRPRGSICAGKKRHI